MTSVGRARTRLVAHALSLPGAWEAHPWNETVAKVGKKIFVFFGQESPDLLVGVKLGRSLHYARTLPAANRFGYGMDDAGWVALRYVKGEDVPVEELREWIDESHELVAPKQRTRRQAAKTRAADPSDTRATKARMAGSAKTGTRKKTSG